MNKNNTSNKPSYNNHFSVSYSHNGQCHLELNELNEAIARLITAWLCDVCEEEQAIFITLNDSINSKRCRKILKKAYKKCSRRRKTLIIYDSSDNKYLLK